MRQLIGSAIQFAVRQSASLSLGEREGRRDDGDVVWGSIDLFLDKVVVTFALYAISCRLILIFILIFIKSNQSLALEIT